MNKSIDEIMKYITYSWTVITILVGICTSISWLIFKIYGNNTSDLQVIGAYLKPSNEFFNKKMPDFNDVVYPVFEIKNLGEKDITLTGMQVKFANSKDLKFKTGIFYAKNTLRPNPNEAKPITIKSKSSEFVSYWEGIYLPKLHYFLTQKSLQNEFFIEHSSYQVITNFEWVDLLNREFKKDYGVNSKIKVTLFTEYKKPIKRFSCKFGEEAVFSTV